MVNKAIIVGRVGNTPEVNTVPNGKKVASMSVATSETWNDTAGNRMEHTEWHRVVAWGGLAAILERYATKGTLVYIEGAIRTRNYEKDGHKVYVTEIVADNIKLLSHAPTTQPDA